MATSTLTDVVKDPGGNVVATSSGTTVNFRLMANGSPTPGFRISDGVNVASLVVTAASTTGSISQALENNKNITPTGTYYVAEILCPTTSGGTQEWALLSSSSASPQNFLQAAAAAIPAFTPITTVPATVLASNNVFTATNQFNGVVRFENGPLYDVTAYGAVGDGLTVTGNVTAIQAAANAITAAGGGITFFPAGVYLVDSFLTYNSNQHWLFAKGAQLKLANAAVANLVRTIAAGTLAGVIQPTSSSAISNVEFTDVDIDGNKSNNPTANSGTGIEIIGPHTDIRVLGYRNTNVANNGLTIGKFGGAAGVPTAIRVRDFVSSGAGLAGVSGGSAIAITEGLDVTVKDFNASGYLLAGVDLEPNSTSAKILADVTLRDGLLTGQAASIGVSISPKNGAQSIYQVLVDGVRTTANDYGMQMGGGGGLALNAADQLTFNGCAAYGNNYNGYNLGSGQRAKFFSCVSDSNSQHGADAASGFRLSGSQFCRFYACDSFGNNLQTYGFIEQFGADHNIYDGIGGSGNRTALIASSSFGPSSVIQNNLAG